MRRISTLAVSLVLCAVGLVGAISPAGAPVSSLASALTLVKDGAIAATNSNSNAGVAALANAVVVPCVNGAYIAVDEGLVIFPAGFVPPGGYIRAVSNPTVIANCP